MVTVELRRASVLLRIITKTVTRAKPLKIEGQVVIAKLHMQGKIKHAAICVFKSVVTA